LFKKKIKKKKKKKRAKNRVTPNPPIKNDREKPIPTTKKYPPPKKDTRAGGLGA
jgi:hypothetical protein